VPASRNATASASDLRLAIGRLVRRMRAEHTFSISQLTVLGRLEREGARTTSALALAEGVRPQSMAETISDLVEQGFAERRPDPGDRRQTLIELTELGRETLARERERREGWLAAAIAGGLSAAEQETLAQAVPLLGRLAEM